MLEGVLEARDNPYLLGTFTEVIEDLGIDRRLLRARLDYLDDLKRQGGVEILHPEQDLMIPTLNTGISILRGFGYEPYGNPTPFLPDVIEMDGFPEITRKLIRSGFLFSERKKGKNGNNIQMLGWLVPSMSIENTDTILKASGINTSHRKLPGLGSQNSLFVLTEKRFADYSRGVGRESYMRIQQLAFATPSIFYDNIIMVEMDLLENTFLATDAYRF